MTCKIIIPFGDLKRQYDSIKTEVDFAVKQVLDSGWFILGKQVEGFEKEFAEYLEVKYAVAVGSGTEALHLALVALGVGSGDEVITVPNTAVFTVSAISFANAKPVFVDIDKNYYAMDAKKIEKAITKKTKAIMPVHLYGQCADMDEIRSVAEKHDIKIVEDACQSHGAEYKSKKAGSIGDIGCFSFYPSKNLGAFGDGGIAVTNSRELADKLKLLRNGGQEKRYFHKIKGFNSRLDEIQAAVLSIKLKYLDKWNDMRRNMASLYDTLITNSKIMKPVEAKYNKHVYHLYVIKTKQRDKLQKYLADNDIQTYVHYPVPVHLQQAYRDLNILKGKYPVAEECSDTILSLPMYPELKKEEVKQICEVINSFEK